MILNQQFWLMQIWRCGDGHSPAMGKCDFRLGNSVRLLAFLLQLPVYSRKLQLLSCSSSFKPHQTRESWKVLGVVLHSCWSQCDWDHHFYRSGRMVREAGLWTDAPVQSPMNKINGKAFLEPFCFRDRPKYLPRALRKAVWGRSWLKPPLQWFGAELQCCCASRSASLAVRHPRAAWCTVGHTETAQQPVPRYLLCSLCLFLSDFRSLVRYKTRNNKNEGKDFGSRM